MALLLFSAGALFAWRSWQTEKEHEWLYLSSIVEITGNSLDGYFEYHGRSLRKLGNDITASSQPVISRTTHDLLKQFKEANPDFIHITVIRPDGQLVLSDSVELGKSLPFSDSDSFRLAVKDIEKTSGLNIGRPIKSLLSAVWSIPLRVGIRDKNNQLKYILVATLPVSNQQTFWQNVPLPDASALGLLRDDDFLVSRYPVPKTMDYEEAYGKPRNGRLVEHLKANNYPARGVTEGFNSIAKANYLFAFHRLSHYPLTVFVSVPLSNVQLKWWHQAQFSLLLFFLLLTGGSLVYRWSSRRQIAWEIEREQNEAQIQFLAHHDALTELPNRMLAKDRMQQAIAFADRQGNKAALLFLDLDNFKSINDSLGHSIGDLLLKQVTQRLQTCLRNTDTLSRQGGDEFLIILTDVGEPEAVTRVAESIQEKLATAFNIESHELSSTLSIGITIYPDDGKDFDTLLRKADTAMYNAKNSGRNTYRFYTEQMNVDADERLLVRRWLSQGLEKEQFVLHYQPQIDLTTGAVIGAEALIRLQHPIAGLVMPGRFITVAEDSGLIIPIGTWVIRQACKQLAEWHEAGRTELVMAVNLSAAQFKRGDLERCVCQALKEFNLRPSSLELELTESILIDDVEGVLATVKQLKGIGVRFSIDDFGTGYSSLAYLKRFNVDKLKIDQSFVRDILNDPEDAAIVHAIVQMARSLNIKTIAEGVEDEATCAFLRTQYCDEAQGYFFSRPIPAEAFNNFLASHPVPTAPSQQGNGAIPFPAPHRG
ncbi:MAG TPA: EAL domain-containing protein [Rhodocyclaceae bacterium]